MTRIVTFSDGFTSASAPSVVGGTQESYAIANNTAVAATLFTIDAAENLSAFVNFELERLVTGTTYRQAGSFILSYDGSSWSIGQGSYRGDDLIKSSVTATQEIALTVTTALGVGSIKYTSGNMVGAAYEGNLKLDIVRISVV